MFLVTNEAGGMLGGRPKIQQSRVLLRNLEARARANLCRDASSFEPQ
jgi:hypothetical protein